MLARSFETARPAVLKIRSVGTLVADTGKYLKAKAAKSGYWLLDERQKSVPPRMMTSLLSSTEEMAMIMVRLIGN